MNVNTGTIIIPPPKPIIDPIFPQQTQAELTKVVQTYYIDIISILEFPLC